MHKLSDLMRKARCGKRTLQFWAKHGVIRAENFTEGAGAGKHRQFSERELIITCALARLYRSFPISISGLYDIAEELRAADVYGPPVAIVTDEGVTLTIPFDNALA